ncbi:protein phosphatase 1L-like [Mya arenaria]|uniref:protein phosphatase 1L-like n=1 Tax=Mya arenaria TaxID=6604 RepID=UPI0022E314FE|nr:protein phosphatase 1L-like [Mya arenaria]
MNILAYLWRMTRRYVLSPESFFVVIVLIVIYNTIVNFTPLTLWQKAREKLRFTTVPSFRKQDSNDQKQNLYWPSDPSKSSWEFKSGNVAVYSIQGRRPHMEDRFKIVNGGNNSRPSIFGIFDGHGGEFTAEYAQQNLHTMILSSVKNGDEDIGEVLTKQILDVDEMIMKEVKHKSDISGSTALVAMVSGTKLTVANVGDSRGVMCDEQGNTVPLSFDHKPNQTSEHQRIKDAGGFIGFNGVWRVAGILATSRALGDYPLKERKFVIAEPDILTFDLSEIRPKFLILATDGLWDCFSNEEAVEYIKERLDEPHFGAKSIILQAYYKGSLDNISVIVVKFDEKSFKKKSR